MAVIGDLREFSLINLIQVNCIDRKTAKLTVTDEEKEAVIFFESGEITHAEYEGLTGASAIYRALGLSRGQFKLEDGVTSPLRTNTRPWAELLLEGMRLLDEKRLGDASPAERVAREISRIPKVKSCAIGSEEGALEAALGGEQPKAEAALAAFVIGRARLLGEQLGLGSPLHLVALGGEPTLIGRSGDKSTLISLRREAGALAAGERDRLISMALSVIRRLA